MPSTRLALVSLAALIAGSCGWFEASPPSEQPGSQPETAAATQDEPAPVAATPEAPAADGSAPSELPGMPLPEGAGFVTTESGLRYCVLKAADGGEPCGPNDIVAVHYTGYFEDGRQFDASNKAGEPARFPCSGVIAGWSEALQLMRPGDHFKLFIPWNLAYGEQGYPGAIPPRSNLIFDVELVEVTTGPKPLQGPEFRLPSDEELTTTESGLRYQVIKGGSGTSPSLSDVVSVHYAGWLTDGTAFDSSFERGEPTSFPLGRVIPGWQEGVQLMSPGAEFLFVIPPELAYGSTGAPPTIGPDATLVFLVQLLSVND